MGGKRMSCMQPLQFQNKSQKASNSSDKTWSCRRFSLFIRKGISSIGTCWATDLERTLLTPLICKSPQKHQYFKEILSVFMSECPVLSCVYYTVKHKEKSFVSHVFVTGVCLFSEHSAVSRTCLFTLFWKGFDSSADEGDRTERWKQLSHQQLSGSDLENLNRIKCLRLLS